MAKLKIEFEAQFASSNLSYEVKVLRDDVVVFTQNDSRSANVDDAKKAEAYLIAEGMNIFRNMMG